MLSAVLVQVKGLWVLVPLVDLLTDVGFELAVRYLQSAFRKSGHAALQHIDVQAFVGVPRRGSAGRWS